MKVATWRGGARFTIDEVPDPVPSDGDVVVKIHTAGICGTDVHMTQGLFPGTPPRVAGHEFSGTVVDAGPGADPALMGAEVVCEPTWECGECPECAAGYERACEHGGRAGGYAEYAALPERAVHRLPPGLGLETAALAEPAACCLSGLEMFEMPEDAVVLVVGGGVMGLFTLAFAKLRGAKVVMMSEPVAARREMAAALGADILVDPTREDLAEVVAGIGDGRGVHVGCEAVGKPALVDEVVRLTRRRGNVQLVGVNPERSTLPSDLYDLHFRELTIRGAFGRGSALPRALAALPGMPAVERMVTARYPLAEVDAAFRRASDATGVKTAIGPND